MVARERTVGILSPASASSTSLRKSRYSRPVRVSRRVRLPFENSTSRIPLEILRFREGPEPRLDPRPGLSQPRR
jgi:hypothetical protein